MSIRRFIAAGSPQHESQSQMNIESNLSPKIPFHIERGSGRLPETWRLGASSLHRRRGKLALCHSLDGILGYAMEVRHYLAHSLFNKGKGRSSLMPEGEWPT